MKSMILPVLFGAGCLLAGCGVGQKHASDPAVRICADANGVRAPDDECGAQPIVGGGHWLYLGVKDIAAAGAPAVGAPARGGSPVPTVAVTYQPAPAAGLPPGG